MADEKKKWIQNAVKHPGGLHRALGVPQGQKIPVGKVDAAAKKGGHLGEMARFAENVRGLGK